VHAVFPWGGAACDRILRGGIWRNELTCFALVVPEHKEVQRVEVHHLPFVVRESSNTADGNIANPTFGITAASFMNDATLLSQWSHQPVLNAAQQRR